MTSSGFDPATFQLVAYCVNQLRYRVPHFYLVTSGKCGNATPVTFISFLIRCSQSPASSVLYYVALQPIKRRVCLQEGIYKAYSVQDYCFLQCIAMELGR
jgi:hypothetical protein